MLNQVNPFVYASLRILNLSETFDKKDPSNRVTQSICVIKIKKDSFEVKKEGI